MRKPWDVDGPHRGRSNPALEEALRSLHEARRGPVTDADRPPVSTFPMTASARAAMRYAKGSSR